MAGKHGATRWQIYDWRRRFRQRGMLAPCEASPSTFASVVVESALEAGHVPAIKLEIAIADVVLRTDAAIDGEQLSRSAAQPRVPIEMSGPNQDFGLGIERAWC
ncbi:IS66 family insertion sequence element accessory protein TnpB [Bradyrhizobium sp. 197]|uniref:hypothetical protein n=1 Tax=Bradyrhizobium sp. 197 TaxID=2782663 RepID=UPI001FF72038|nr:hypothetical protein [Bradyrhizobium sp. 197]MCK1474123.1 IS66 family insertion sequence element accessory protein TnpB [Bradyrhizobium sp. 197]